ncbi:MAG: hypothetical protein ABI662_12245 [Dermatophilaceae bacterium]
MTQAQSGHAQATVFGTVRRWFEDTGPFTAFAVTFLVLGSLFVLAEVQSPSMLQWNGTGVHASQSGGIAFYSFRGQTYTLNVPTPAAFSSTIYIDPAEPSTAMFSNPVTRWTEAGTVAGPFVVAALLLALGFVRKARRRRLRRRQRGALYAVKESATGKKGRRSAQGRPS